MTAHLEVHQWRVFGPREQRLLVVNCYLKLRRVNWLNSWNFTWSNVFSSNYLKAGLSVVLRNSKFLNLVCNSGLPRLLKFLRIFELFFKFCFADPLCYPCALRLNLMRKIRGSWRQISSILPGSDSTPEIMLRTRVIMTIANQTAIFRVSLVIFTLESFQYHSLLNLLVSCFNQLHNLKNPHQNTLG